MIVPFSAADFLDRALAVYADRVGAYDEPDQPAPSLGDLTYAQVGERARAMAAKHDRLGLEVGDRVAFVSHNSARLLTAFFGVCGYGRVLVPINFRLSADEVAYIVEHSGARVLYVDPELKEALAGVKAEHTFILGEDDDLYGEGEPRPWEHDENATATINYTSGTTARPKGVQITHRNIWTNAVTFGLHAGVTDRDVYLHTLPMFHANGWGMPFAMTGLGVPQVVLRKVDGAEILRRVEKHGVTVMCAAPAVVNAVLDAAADWDGRDPRTRPGPDHRGRSATADEDRGARGGRARLGVHPDLRADRDLAAADHQPQPRGVGRPRRPRSARPSWSARERRRSASPSRSATATRCWPAPTSCSRATGSSPRRPPGPWPTAGSTPATAA